MSFAVWTIGLVFCLFASIFGIAGKILLKVSHLKDSTKLFVMGLVCIVLFNPVLSTIAYKFAPQSLIAPMAGLSIVWNTVLAPLILKEPVSFRDVAGATLIFAGCIMVGISGSHTNTSIPVQELKSHFLSTPFLLYFVVFSGLVCCLTVGAWPALWHRIPGKKLTRVCFASLSGVVAGQMYFVSALMHIIGPKNAGGSGVEAFNYPVTYIVIVGAILFAGSGLALLNYALALYDAVFVIYLYEACYILAGAISGICFFNEMATLTSWHYVVYTCSLVQIFLGIHIISKREETYIEDEQSKKAQQDSTKKPLLGTKHPQVIRDSSSQLEYCDVEV